MPSHCILSQQIDWTKSMSLVGRWDWFISGVFFSWLQTKRKKRRRRSYSKFRSDAHRVISRIPSPRTTTTISNPLNHPLGKEEETTTDRSQLTSIGITHLKWLGRWHLSWCRSVEENVSLSGLCFERSIGNLSWNEVSNVGEVHVSALRCESSHVTRRSSIVHRIYAPLWHWLERWE